MNTIKGLNAAIRYFAWGAAVGGLVLIGALVVGLLRIIPSGGAFALACVGLVVSAVSFREIRRGHRLKARLLQVGEELEQAESRKSHLDGTRSLIGFYTWGIFISGVAVIVALLVGLLRVVPVGASIAVAAIGFLSTIASVLEVRRGRRLRSKRIRATHEHDEQAQ